MRTKDADTAPVSTASAPLRCRRRAAPLRTRGSPPCRSPEHPQHNTAARRPPLATNGAQALPVVTREPASGLRVAEILRPTFSPRVVSSSGTLFLKSPTQRDLKGPFYTCTTRARSAFSEPTACAKSSWYSACVTPLNAMKSKPTMKHHVSAAGFVKWRRGGRLHIRVKGTHLVGLKQASAINAAAVRKTNEPHTRWEKSIIMGCSGDNAMAKTGSRIDDELKTAYNLWDAVESICTETSTEGVQNLYSELDCLGYGES